MQVPSPSRLNPLHQSDGRAVRILGPELLGLFDEITKAVSRVIDLGFYAIDLILGESGPTILEINPNPICYFYNSHNGRADFVGIYERLIRKFLIRGDVPMGLPAERLAVAGKMPARLRGLES